MRKYAFRSGLVIFASLVLAACGPFQVQVEPTQPSPQSTRPATAAPTPPTPLSTETAPPTLVPEASATPPAQPGESPTLAPTAVQEIKITTVHMNTTMAGWAIGTLPGQTDDNLFTTRDGGHTWSLVTPGGTPPKIDQTPVQIIGDFLDSQTAWIIYASPQSPSGEMTSVVWHTTDGGKNWTASQPLDTTNLNQEFFIPVLHFADAQNGWLLAHLGVGMSHDYFALFSTVDSGANWKRLIDPQSTNPPQSCSKTSFAFKDAQTGWLAIDCHGVMPGLQFYQTSDGGVTWSPDELPAPADQPDLFSNQNNACGVEEIHVTSSQTRNALVRCSDFSANTTKSYVYAGDDATGTWAPYLLPASYGNLDFITPQTGWFIGTSDPNNQGPAKLFHTTDGGQTWKAIANLDWFGVPNFVDDLNGWLVAHLGDQSALVHTMDGGVLWTQLKPVQVP